MDKSIYISDFGFEWLMRSCLKNDIVLPIRGDLSDPETEISTEVVLNELNRMVNESIIQENGNSFSPTTDIQKIIDLIDSAEKVIRIYCSVHGGYYSYYYISRNGECAVVENSLVRASFTKIGSCLAWTIPDRSIEILESNDNSDRITLSMLNDEEILPEFNVYTSIDNILQDSRIKMTVDIFDTQSSAVVRRIICFRSESGFVVWDSSDEKFDASVGVGKLLFKILNDIIPEAKK